jgi:hypothetical protein
LDRALTAFPGLTPGEAVFLLAHQVPVNRQNVTLFHRMSLEAFQLGSLLTRLEQVLDGPDGPAPSAASTGQLPAHPPADAQPGGAAARSPAGNPPPLFSGETVSPPVPAAAAPPPAPETLPTALERRPVAVKIPAPPPSGQSPAPAPTGQSQPSAPPPRAAVTLPAPVGASAPERADLPSGAVPAQAGQTMRLRPFGWEPPPPRSGGQINLPAASPPPSEAETPPRPLAPAPDRPDTAAEPGAPGRLDARTPVPAAQPPEGQAPPDSADALSRLRGMVKSLFRQVRPERSQALPGELDAARLTRETAETLRAVGERIHELPPQRREAALSLARDIADGLQFAQRMELFSAVVQLPLQLGGRETSAALYVFGDGSRKNKIDARNATLFLSLSTARMGRVEVLTRVIGTNVECDFKLAQKAWADRAQKDGGRLRELLAQNGFQLTRSSFEKTEAPAEGPLAAAQEKEKFAKRYTFEAKI